MRPRTVVLRGLVLGALIAAAACAPVQVHTYVPRSANLTQYHTYAWAPAGAFETGDPRLDNNTLFIERLQSAVEGQLARKGWAPAVGSQPDLVIHFHARVDQRLDLRDAKPSAAVTEREEEPVQANRRIVQSQRRAPAKRPVVNVGTSEVKTSVFVNLRQGPSPSAKAIRVVAKGTKLRVVARKGRWVQVTDPATSAKGWIYTGNANPPRSTEPSAPAEASENTQPKPDSVDTHPKSDPIWPSFLRGSLASR